MLKARNVFWLMFLVFNALFGFYLYYVLGLYYLLLAPALSYLGVYITNYFLITKIILNNRLNVLRLQNNIRHLSYKRLRYLNDYNFNHDYLDLIIFLDIYINYYQELIDQQKQVDLFIDSISLFPNGFLKPLSN